VIGRVNNAATAVVAEDGPVTVYQTEIQAGMRSRKVDLKAYRNAPVALLCQGYRGGSTAWGCEAIGILKPTKALPPKG
jgi:hypothetical protein